MENGYMNWVWLAFIHHKQVWRGSRWRMATSTGCGWLLHTTNKSGEKADGEWLHELGVAGFYTPQTSLERKQMENGYMNWVWLAFIHHKQVWRESRWRMAT